jgi:hypothetical protein
MDANILVAIAKHNRRVWKLFSVICKDWCKIFNPLSYEHTFQQILTHRTDTLIEIHYMLDNLQHRSDGPSFSVYDFSNRTWCRYWQHKDKTHRIGGPAIEYGKIDNTMWIGTECSELENLKYDRCVWYENNLRHRTDGPAVDNGIYSEFWLRGIYYKEDEFNKAIEMHKKCMFL